MAGGLTQHAGSTAATTWVEIHLGFKLSRASISLFLFPSSGCRFLSLDDMIFRGFSGSIRMMQNNAIPLLGWCMWVMHLLNMGLLPACWVGRVFGYLPLVIWLPTHFNKYLWEIETHLQKQQLHRFSNDSDRSTAWQNAVWFWDTKGLIQLHFLCILSLNFSRYQWTSLFRFQDNSISYCYWHDKLLAKIVLSILIKK